MIALDSDTGRDCVSSLLCDDVAVIVWEAVGGHCSKIVGDDRSYLAEWSSFAITK